ncbi:MAG: pyridoxamine 5'-phosphate oxidase family protein [Deltaproteobacteria bacterium]|nr:pyridoxamine 5'-phosphate oxidase family protein [Deltaproteobacteria bacterium]
MDRKEVMALVNKPGWLGTLSTADLQGNVNAGVFSSAHMPDEDSVVVALGQNRTLDNLGKNPKAALCVFETAASPYDWKGARIYLEAKAIEASGPLFDNLVALVRQAAGDQAAQMTKAAVSFRITGVRPLIDMGV